MKINNVDLREIEWFLFQFLFLPSHCHQGMEPVSNNLIIWVGWLFNVVCLIMNLGSSPWNLNNNGRFGLVSVIG